MKITGLLISALLFAANATVFGQNIKTTEVVKLGNGVIIVTKSIRYNSSNKPTDTTFQMSGKNQKLSSINESVVLYKGNLKGLKVLLTKCQEAFADDSGVAIKYGESVMRIDRILGVKGLTLYGIGGDSNDNVHLSKSQVVRLRDEVK